MSLPRYSNYKNSGTKWLGDVPAHWHVTRIKYECSVMPSNVDKKSYDGETAIVLCNYTDVYYNENITNSIEFMPATASGEQISRFTLRGGDTLITKDSETADDIAISAYVPEDMPGVVCGYHLAVIRPKHAQNGLYIKRLFDSYYLKACFAVAANGLTRVGLSQYALDNVVIPLPPPDEQSAISVFLESETSKIDALIAEQEKLLELLAEKRQAAISRAVTRGLNADVPMKDSGVASLGRIPLHWTTKQLRHIAKIVRGASPRPAGDPRFFSNENDGDGCLPWVTVAEITKDDAYFLETVSEYLTSDGVQNSQKFKSGTVIFTNSGATLGVPKILKIDCCANDGILAFKNLSPDVEPLFLYMFLSTTTERLRTEMKQGGGQPNLNTDIVKGIGFAQPPIHEQRAIVNLIQAELKRLDSLKTQALHAIELLSERRSALISAAVTGKIDIREHPSALAEAA